MRKRQRVYIVGFYRKPKGVTLGVYGTLKAAKASVRGVEWVHNRRPTRKRTVGVSLSSMEDTRYYIESWPVGWDARG